MGEDRMQELGIPRRRFLKGAAAATFAAPVIVSFGLDGVASAQGNQTYGNQSLPNQASTLVNLIREMVQAIEDGEATLSTLEPSAFLTLQAALVAASGNLTGYCGDLAELIRSLEALPSRYPFNQWLAMAQFLQAESGCGALGAPSPPRPGPHARRDARRRG